MVRPEKTISNGAGGGGGAIGKGNPGIVNVSNCTLSGNSISGSGGGGAVVTGMGGGTMNIHNSTLSGNTAGGSSGGGVFNYPGGTVNITNSTLSGNSAENDSGGGGIYNSGGATMNIINSTLSGNSADASGGGGGGGIANLGTLVITNSTVAGNSAAFGGGVYSSSSFGTANVRSSIIAMNTLNGVGGNVGPDVYGPFNPAGFNLIGKNDDAAASFPAGNPNANNDIVGTSASPIDPNFELDAMGKPLLKNNGGPTQTVALLFGSPAIDKGTSNGSTGTLSTDQRGSGFPRTFDDPAIPNATGSDGTDVGAFELQTAAPPTPTPTPTPPTTLGNISTRLRVETGDNVLIGGFIVTGTQPKKVIVRAIGTSLPFADRLADPVLELHGPNGLIESNDNWVDSPNKQAIIDSTIPPASDLESAIVQTLPANSTGYTAIVRGVNNGTGIGLVEAYDLNTTVDSKLANISTRGFVQTGDNVLIAGTIVLGPSTQKVIVRAIGPSLTVPGKLEDPILELRDANGGLVRGNDNWRTGGQEAEIIATTIPPTNDFESALVETLSGNGASYTAIVRGVNNTTGIAVVEVYALN